MASGQSARYQAAFAADSGRYSFRHPGTGDGWCIGAHGQRSLAGRHLRAGADRDPFAVRFTRDADDQWRH
jgi:hypothetical protein